MRSLRSSMSRAAAILAATALVLGPAVDGGAATATDVRCGTKALYGKTLTIHVVGTPIPCSEARAIIRGQCRARKTWSCFSLRAPDPLLVWFKERERFAKHWSTTIEARRYPCRQARVTARAWASARRSHANAFPSRQQVLADDLVRCKQLRGRTFAEVQAVLGRPDGSSQTRGRRRADWFLGLERDSFFQVDSELLALTFGRDDVLSSIRFVQG